MSHILNLNEQIKILAEDLIVSEKKHENLIHTHKLLYELAFKKNWTLVDEKQIVFFAKKIDISKKVYTFYSQDGKIAERKTVSEEWMNLISLILAKYLLLGLNEKISKSELLKRFNVFFKVIELSRISSLEKGSEFGDFLFNAWDDFIKTLPSEEISVKITDVKNTPSKENLIEIPLEVLFFEGPIARAYLETIKSLGFMPKKIIHLVSIKDIATKKPVGRFLPFFMRKAYANAIQIKKIHYWPKKLSQDHQEIHSELLDNLRDSFGFKKSTLHDAAHLKSLDTYSNNVEQLLIEDLKDPVLFEYLSNKAPTEFLFTGGGIVPAELFNLKQLKFIHIHPGFLPDIRGADCLLWSVLMTGYASATCFFMNAGIDMGDIINPCWLPKFKLPKALITLDEKTFYRVLYAYVDPWVRAYVLRNTLLSSFDFKNVKVLKQKEEDGTTFHFMHDLVKASAFSKFQY